MRFNKHFLFLNACIASVFSKASISGTTTRMRDAMELVASRVDELGKAKITPQANLGTTAQPRPTTTTTPVQPTQTTSTAGPTKPKQRKKKTDTAYADWDAKKYKGTEDSRRMDREQRRLAREKKQKEAEEELAKKVQALQTFEDDEEEETEAPEPDPPAPVPEKPTKESVGVRNKRLELERRREDKAKRDAEKAEAAANPEPPQPKSPRQGKSPGRSTKGGKTPKRKTGEPTTSGEKGDGNKKASDARPTKGAKVPRQKQTTQGDDATNREVASRTRGGSKASDGTTNRTVGKKSTAQHVDDQEYELDLKTGKFVKKKQEMVQREDEDDDDDVQMEEIDDEDIDENYDPDKDPDKGIDDDEDDEENVEPEDDDFEIPPLRKKKAATKPSDKSTRQKKKPTKGKTGADEALEDLGDFVEATFRKPVKQPRSKGPKGAEHDACINPKEAARFRRAMRAETLELENAVKTGTDIEETYKAMIGHIVEACKDMKYDIPTDIEAKDIIPAIDDLSCRAWQMKMQGIETAGEGELNVSRTDNSGICVAKKKYSIKDIMEYTEEVSSNWSDLKRKNFNLAMKKIMGNMTVAHRMVADASQEMINLLDEIELPLWMKIADLTMRPLVHMEVPEVAVMCEEAKQLSKANEQVWDQTTKITTIMESKSLPVLPASWGYDREGKAKKLIAGIVYKYVKDRMYWGQAETPATEVSKKFIINSTTMNRHILGKKYIGGKSSGGSRKPVAQKVEATNRRVEKSKVARVEPDGDEQEGEPPKKSKGSGKSSKVTRSAKEIRDQSTSDKQKEKAKKRKAEEAELDEELAEDPDMPTKKEREAALKALAAKGSGKSTLRIVH